MKFDVKMKIRVAARQKSHNRVNYDANLSPTKQHTYTHP